MNPWMLLGVVLAVAGAGGGGFWYGTGVGHDQCIAERAKDEELVRRAGEAAALVAADAISKIEVKNVTQKQILQREIVENVVYRDCRHTPDGLRALNDTLTGGKRGTDKGELPRVDPAVK